MAALAVASTPRTAGAEAGLAYRFQLQSTPELAVFAQLVTRGADNGRTDFVVSRSWGGVDAGGEDIHDVTVRDARGRELAVAHPEPHRWQVEHAPGEKLAVRWRFARTAYQADMSP